MSTDFTAVSWRAKRGMLTATCPQWLHQTAGGLMVSFFILLSVCLFKSHLSPLGVSPCFHCFPSCHRRFLGRKQVYKIPEANSAAQDGGIQYVRTTVEGGRYRERECVKRRGRPRRRGTQQRMANQGKCGGEG